MFFSTSFFFFPADLLPYDLLARQRSESSLSPSYCYPHFHPRPLVPPVLRIPLSPQKHWCRPSPLEIFFARCSCLTTGRFPLFFFFIFLSFPPAFPTMRKSPPEQVTCNNLGELLADSPFGSAFGSPRLRLSSFKGSPCQVASRTHPDYVC